MRHFSLQIGNETRGPLTEEEITALIAEGAVTADTPCAPVGATEWTPLSQHFSFGSNLKLKRSKQVLTEAEDQASAQRIDPDLRKKLLVYGLADAASVDGFTQVQALAAVNAKEGALRAQHRTHALVRWTCFTLGIPLAFAAGLYAPLVPAALSLIADVTVPAQSSAKAELAAWRQSAQQMRVTLHRLRAYAFEAPPGDLSASDAVANRMQSDQNTSFSLHGRLAPSETLKKQFGPANRNRRALLLKSMPSGRLQELLRTSEEKLAAGQADWAAFQSKNGREMEKLLEAETLKAAAIDEKGAFVLEAIPPVNTSMCGQFVVEFRVNGAKAFATWSPPLFEVVAFDAQLLANSFFVSREKYFVTKKLEVGGVTLKAKVITPVHSFEVTRVTPKWRYLAVARKEDLTPLYLLVDEKAYAVAKAGDAVDIAKLLKMRCYAAPAESPVPPGMSAL